MGDYRPLEFTPTPYDVDTAMLCLVYVFALCLLVYVLSRRK